MQTEKSRKLKITLPLKREIIKIVDERIKDTLGSEMRELKVAVKDLAEAQKGSEERLTRLERAIEELTEAQKETQKEVSRLDKALQELAEAQKRTEQKVEELAEAQKRTESAVETLVRGLNEVRRDVGGLSRTMSYAFENEAFRMLPKFLKEKYSIEIIEKFIREEILGREINIFAKARKNGKEIYIVGESKLRLDERRDEGIDEILEELEEKVRAVKKEFGDVEIVPLLITHYATKGFLREASKRGIIVIQSFEW